MDTFIFNVTKICDKNCSICCNSSGNGNLDSMSFELFNKKLQDIANYAREKNIVPTICIVGGEAFLYKFDAVNGNRYKLVDLVKAALKTIKGCKVVIKTSGWCNKSEYYDTQLTAIQELIKDNSIEIKLGLNLYQKGGKDAESRLGNILKKVERVQACLCIDTIYDKTNVINTIELFENVLDKNNFKTDKGIQNLLEKPDVVSQYIYYSKQLTIKINTSPAFNPDSTLDKNDIYWDIKTQNICPYQKNMHAHLLYDHNLNIYHCNDPYADYSVSGIPSEHYETIEEEENHFKNKFHSLLGIINRDGIKFKNKRERCLFCSKYLLEHGC